MKIQINNLGIIGEGTVNLNRNLTVFCGANGTGKTYFSYLIYALVSDNMSPVKPLSLQDMEVLVDNGFVDIPIPTESAIEFRNKTIEIIKSRMNEIFGISKKNAERLFKDFEMSFLSPNEEFIKAIRKQALIIDIKLSSNSFKVEKKRDRMEFRLRRDKRQTITLETMQALQLGVSSLVYQRFLTHAINQAHIFVVERSSIFTFNKELSLSRATLVDTLHKEIDNNFNKNKISKLIQSNSTRYPLAISRNIRFASDLNQIKKDDCDYSSFADDIEKQLLNGNHVDVDPEGNVYLQVNRNLTLPIHMAASVAKTLATLILTLRHKTHKGDLLIIDEPELNLHPAAQILFARIMARMINNGLRLLISTHSDYIIREINNMIMWGAIKNDDNTIRKELGYDKKEILKKNNVGVYVFEFDSNSKNRVSINEIPVDDNGFEIESIDNSIRLLNESGENAYAIKLAQINRK